MNTIKFGDSANISGTIDGSIDERLVRNRKSGQRRYRAWQSLGTIHEVHKYVHEKIIMGNYPSVELWQKLQQIADFTIWGNQTRHTSSKEVRLTYYNVGAKDEQRSTVDEERKGKNPHWSDHTIEKCPIKKKCFKCKEQITTVCFNRYIKEVTIGSRSVEALISTSNDISLMCASQYKLCGSPKLRGPEILLFGLGYSSAWTQGWFDIQAVIDGNTYTIYVHVVSDENIAYDLVIGTDFLHSVEVNAKNNEILISPIRADDQNVRTNSNDRSDTESASEIDVSTVDWVWL